ncbi:MAG: hypothetical protein QOF48_3190, partial [Verrucomicrobiota bacterium]
MSRMKAHQVLLFLIVSLCGLSAVSAADNFVLTEFMAVNDNGLRDEDLNYSDWIEVYNNSGASADIGGWYLTDDPANLRKWRFPSRTFTPYGYLVVFASNKDRTNATGNLHTNFRLSSSGEFLALVRPDGVTVATQFTPKFPDQVSNVPYGLSMITGPTNLFLASGSSGKVYVPSNSLGTAWTALGYDDSAWLSATVPAGFDTGTNYDPIIATDLQAQMAGVNSGVYLRMPFTIADFASIQELKLRLRYDDGFVAYLNGVEVARRNAPVAPVWNSSASASHGSEPGGGGSLQCNFDDLTSPFTLTQYSAAPAASVQTANAGSTGSFLRLLTDGVNNNINGITFNQTAPGLFQAINADFDFRVTDAAGNPADGFAFLLIPTATYGTTGAGLAIPAGIEEPNFANVFAVGFDFYPHGTQNDVSAHWNGAELFNATILRGTIEMVSGAFHHCSVSLRHADGGAYVTVIITPNVNATPGAPYTAINNLFIPGLNPYDCRAQFGGRTGGADMSVDLDNINVQFGYTSGLVAVEDFDVTSSLASLHPGANVLAIHGLNATNSPDFLLAPELVSRSVTLDPNVALYFSTPTPGSVNGPGAPGLSAPPSFSIAGGVFTNSVAVTLSTVASAVIRYTIDGSEPTNSSAIYSSTLTLANSTVLRAKAFESNKLPSDPATQTYTILSPELLNFSSGLPMVIINMAGQPIVAETRRTGAITIIDTYRGRSSLLTPAEYRGLAQFEVRGQTSAGFAKKQFNVELNDEHGYDVSRGFLGLPPDSDWVLHDPYNDKTFMNDTLAHTLFEAMGHYAVRRRYVEVFVDEDGGKLTYPGNYYGIMELFEKIKVSPDRVGIAAMSPTDAAEPAISGGYMFKKDKDSPGDLSFTTTGNAALGFSGQTLKIHSPKPAEITTPQLNWLRNYLNLMEASMYAANWTNATGTNHYSYYLDVDSFVDFHWIVEFSKQIDGVRLSNYMQKDRNGKVKMEPIWDWNLSFGNANYLQGGLTNGWYWNNQAEGMDNVNHLWLRRLIYGSAVVSPSGAANGPGDPDFRQKITDRWGQLRTNVFLADNLIARVDVITNLLNEAKDRDFAKFPRLSGYTWPNPDGANLVPSATDGTAAIWDINYATPPNYASMISEQKKWIRGRYAWVDAQFHKAPTMSHPAGYVASGYQHFISAPAGTIYFTLDGSDPRLPGGGISPSAQVYSGPIAITNNARVVARSYSAGSTLWTPWSPPDATSLVITTPALIISEIMYHPAPPAAGSTNSASDFEYVELKNVGATTINLRNVRISGGINFTFPASYPLAPNQTAVLVKNLAAFQSRYGMGIPVAGVYGGTFNNGGEHLVLEGPMREPILDFTFNDSWYPTTDGLGFSLVVVNENAPRSAWGTSANWRPSGVVNGSPGASEGSAPVIPTVWITEVLTHTDVPPPLDTIELYNPGAAAADIGGWFLSDDLRSPKKYRIADGTMIAAGGYLTFNESHFNATNGPGVFESFSLAADGDEVYLASGDASTNLTGYVHGFSFGAQRNGVTFGRYITSVGNEHFVAQSGATLGAPNSGPLIGPIVISEIMFHPPDVFTNGAYWNNAEDEYIELANFTGSPVPLYDPAHPANTWSLGGVDFGFPAGVTVPASGYLLIVNFNPYANPAQESAFRMKYNVSPTVQILGPYEGNLNNLGEGIAVYRPDAPIPQPSPLPDKVPSVLVDRVQYSDHAPWPAAGDGTGHSIHRKFVAQYGNDPVNWNSGAPSPGAAYVPGTAPTITTQPESKSAFAGTLVSLSVSAGPAPVRYQWRHNDENVPGATNATLTFSPVQTSDAGQYQVIVLNNTSSVASSNATLTVVVAASFVLHPQPVSLRGSTNAADYGNTTNQNATFSASATGNGTVRYQWRFNGVPIPNATNASVTITNVQLANDGLYDVLATDDIGTVPSNAAKLTVILTPIIIVAPVSQTVPAGSRISVGVAITGNPPPFGYQWRSNSYIYPLIVSNSRTNFVTLPTWPLLSTNVVYRIVVTNVASTGNGVFAAFNVSTVADTDVDGIPDFWSQQYFGHATGQAGDLSRAGDDFDGDRMSNLAEYLAGTDPTNPNSYLRIDLVAAPGAATVQFAAVSNRTYTVEYTDTVPAAAPWTRLADFFARSTNRVESFLDPA